MRDGLFIVILKILPSGLAATRDLSMKFNQWKYVYAQNHQVHCFTNCLLPTCHLIHVTSSLMFHFILPHVVSPHINILMARFECSSQQLSTCGFCLKLCARIVAHVLRIGSVWALKEHRQDRIYSLH